VSANDSADDTAAAVRAQAYVKSAAQAIVRLMSMQQFRSDRPYFGSFDQMHWIGQAEDTLTLYSPSRTHNARFQEASLTLAWFYKNDPTGEWRGNSELRNRAQAGLAFWSRLQWPDGSFAETNPIGHEFGTTAFTLTAAVETVRLIGDDWDDAIVPRDQVLRAIRRAALYLAGLDGTNNLEAAAALGLLEAGLLLNDQMYLRESVAKLEKLLDIQSPEGFFPEMGGPDSGYNSLTLSLLGRYYYLARAHDAIIPAELEKRLLEAVGRAFVWQSLFFRDDGSQIGGSWNTRSSTPWIVRGGFEVWTPLFPLAERLSGVLPISDSMGMDGDDRHTATDTYRYLWSYEAISSPIEPEDDGPPGSESSSPATWPLLPVELAKLMPADEAFQLVLPQTRVQVVIGAGKYEVTGLMGSTR